MDKICVHHIVCPIKADIWSETATIALSEQRFILNYISMKTNDNDNEMYFVKNASVLLYKVFVVYF